tara:strand:- start:100277 stop:100384 length:108 start_codon:yes stop_codon:yes gene_type:complete
MSEGENRGDGFKRGNIGFILSLRALMAGIKQENYD